MPPIKIKVIHLGEDYAVIKVGTKEYQVSLGLGQSILSAQHREKRRLKIVD